MILKELASIVMIVTTIVSGAVTEADRVRAGEAALAEPLPKVHELKSGRRVTKEMIEQYGGSRKLFRIYKIKKKSSVYRRIYGKSFPKSGFSLSELRYLKVLYRDFKGRTRSGELIVNKKIATKTKAIFYKLYRKKYRIRRMKLIDDYFPKKFSNRQQAAVQADENSMNADNTSAFNYRNVAGSGTLSNHAKGFCIDVNPFENPWAPGGRVAANQIKSKKYADRSVRRPHMIFADSYITKTFKSYGFRWGGELFADYQHFEY